MAALKHLLFTTKALLAVFDGAENENAIVTDETSVHAMLTRDLLLFPSLTLDLKYRIVHNNMDEVLAILTQPKPTKYGLQEAFNARLAADDIEGAYLINEWLLEIGDATASECNEKLERALDMRWENSEATRKHLVEEVEHAYFRDQIDSETRELLAALVTGTVHRDLPQILDAQKRCKEVESELDENRERCVRRMKHEFQNLEQDLSDAERETFYGALEDGNLVAAREFLGRLQKGEGIGEPEQSRNRLLDFLDRVGEIELSMSGTERPTLERIDSAAKQGQAIAGLDFSSMAESEVIVPSRLLEPWRRLTRRQSACRGDLTELLEAIGFDNVRVELDGHSGAAMVCSPLADRQLCPLHVYGSKARDRARDPRGHYQILLSWPQLGRPSRDSLIQLVDAAGSHAIVLHFGALRDDRDELRRWSIYNHRCFIVLDETLLSYLSTVGNGRLCTFFECTLPFTCVDPFVTTASIVPPEMFYGRAREKMEIMNPFGSCFVYGGRQLGKTALLRSAEADFNRSSSRQLAKWIDLKHNEIGLARDAADIWPVLWRALQEIDVISSETPAPRGEDGLRDALSEAIQEWIGDSGHMLLLLDEADAFLMRDARTDFIESTRLKGIMESTERRFKVVFSGLHNVLRSTERANHPLAHLGQAICVGPLLFNGEWREAQKLVRQPLRAIGCCFKDQLAVLHVLAQTNYYPSLIQLFGAELVRYVRDLKSFPYRLGVDDIASVFKRPAVRDAIRERFLLTLQLDDRYEVVAFAMALEFSGDHGALAKGMPRDRILELAQEHWEDGFPTSTNDVTARSEERMNFDVLLQEMEGLGVLRRVHNDGRSGHFYTLRNPNILALLGTNLEIEQTLDKDRRLPELFEPDSFRDRYESAKGEPRHGMLTNEQEARLRDSAVSVIVGNSAARIDEVRDFLGRATKASPQVLEDCLDANHFRRELTKSRPDRNKRRVFLVPEVSRWRVTWLHGAFEALRRMQRGRFVRVVFVADPAMLWMTLKDLEDGTSLGDERVEWLSAGPWDLTFLRHWCDVQDLTANREQINDLLEISGGWPMVLERYEKSHSKVWDKRIQDLSQLVKDESDDFRCRLGIDAEAEKQLSELLNYEGLSGHAMEELDEYDTATLTTLKRRLSWAIHLRLASLREGAIEFNPLVKRVVRPGGLAMTFWELPGSIRYVEEIAQALRLGSNVVVRFPCTIPPAFRDRVFSAVRGDGIRPTPLPCASRPLESLCERFLHAGSSTLDGLRLLVDCDDFSERLICIECVSAEEWSAWHEFLLTYADVSRSIEVHRRTLFLVLLIVPPSVDCTSQEEPPRQNVLQFFDWDDVIDEMDILFYASDRLRRKGIERSSEKLIAMTVARLTIWDFGSAERLVEERPEHILEPVPFFRDMAKERGWDQSTPIRWTNGTASQSGIAHPARLGVEEPARDIVRRAWSAQAAVLLPEIDIQRDDIIRSNLYEVRRWLNDHDSDQDPFDLEIGDLYKIFRVARADAIVRKHIADLRMARNKLAHLESISPRSAFRIAGSFDV